MRGWICGAVIGLSIVCCKVHGQDDPSQNRPHDETSDSVALFWDFVHEGQERPAQDKMPICQPDSLLPAYEVRDEMLRWEKLSVYYLLNEHGPTLARFLQLKHLCVYGTYVDGEGLRFVGQLKSIETLTFLSMMGPREDTWVEIQGRGFLAIPPDQRKWAVRFRDDDLRHVGNLPALQALFVTNQPINGSGLIHLAKLKHFTKLSFAITDIADEHAPKLGQLPRLESLYLRDNPLTGKTLPKMDRLKCLSFDDCPISREFAAHPEKFPNLETLWLHDIEGLDGWLVQLAQFPTVKTLHISENDVSTESIAKLQTARPDLVIDVWREPKPTPSGYGVPTSPLRRE